MIIEGECFLITERLNLLKPSIFRKYLIKIIEDIQLLNTTDDNIENLLKVCLEYKNKQHEPCNECCNLHSIEGLLIFIIYLFYYCFSFVHLIKFYVFQFLGKNASH